jgi:hypothetical protein
MNPATDGGRMVSQPTQAQRNFLAFSEKLPELLSTHQGKYTHEALLGMDLMGTGTFTVNGLLKMATFCW